jgi:antitoxin VapB
MSKKPPTAAATERAGLRSKAFRTGGSIAVRIPREYQLPGTEVMISKVKEGLLISALPAVTTAADWWTEWEADPTFMADGRQQPAMQVRDFGP